MHNDYSGRIAQLEQRIAHFIEGVFGGLIERRMNAHELALQLSRSMNQHLRLTADGRSMLAPDCYQILISPEAHHALMHKLPELSATLCDYLEAYARQAHYQLSQAPSLHFVAQTGLERHQVVIQALHSPAQLTGTQALQAVNQAPNTPQLAPHIPRLIINGTRTLALEAVTLNLGRGEQNHIILDDPHASRHHAQLRLREGSYLLFDANSASGTFVNGVRIYEHRLQNGDLIVIGTTQLLYLLETPKHPDHLSTTIGFDPIP